MRSGGAASALVCEEQADVFSAPTHDSSEFNLLLSGLDGVEQGRSFCPHGSLPRSDGALEPLHGGRVGHDPERATFMGPESRPRRLTIGTSRAKIFGTRKTGARPAWQQSRTPATAPTCEGALRLSSLPASSSPALTTTEIWVPTPGIPGYEVSNLGRVRGIDRTVHFRDGRVYRYRGQILRPAINPVSGYPHVAPKGISRNIHRLVLEAFVGPCPPGMLCRHLNGNPADNRLENLRWGTPSENSYDKGRHGTDHNAAKDVCIRGHRLAEPNLAPALRTTTGWRSCLACDRAQSTVRKAHENRGIELDVDEVAARKYRYIMRGAKGALIPVRPDGPVGLDMTWAINPGPKPRRAAHAVSTRVAGATVCGREVHPGSRVVTDWTCARQCHNCVRFIVNGVGWS